MEVFSNKIKEVVDLGGGNKVTLRNLSYAEVLAIGEGSPEATIGRYGYEMVCASVESWTGPAFADFPEPSEEAFNQLSEDFFRAVNSTVVKMRGLSTDEGNESAEPLNKK